MALRILFVEDHNYSRQTVSRLLRHFHYDVVAAPDYRTASEIEFRQDDPAFSPPRFFPIEYSDEPVVLDLSGPITPDEIASLLRRKRSGWKSEMESRLAVALSVATVHDLDEGRRYFIPLGSDLVVSFTLGLRTNEKIRRTVIELLRRPNFAHVKGFRTHLNIETGLLERELL